MAAEADWVAAFARQADADFRAWVALQAAEVSDCHRLQSLQMTCEKLVKAYAYHKNYTSEKLQTSHAWVAKLLPSVLREHFAAAQVKGKTIKSLERFLRQIAGEIELLCPAVDDEGRRPDNVEYPWEDAQGKVRSPLDHSFAVITMLDGPFGPVFLKLVRLAIDAQLPS